MTEINKHWLFERYPTIGNFRRWIFKYDKCGHEEEIKLGEGVGVSYACPKCKGDMYRDKELKKEK